MVIQMKSTSWNLSIAHLLKIAVTPWNALHAQQDSSFPIAWPVYHDLKTHTHTYRTHFIYTVVHNSWFLLFLSKHVGIWQLLLNSRPVFQGIFTFMKNVLIDILSIAMQHINSDLQQGFSSFVIYTFRSLCFHEPEFSQVSCHEVRLITVNLILSTYVLRER